MTTPRVKYTDESGPSIDFFCDDATIEYPMPGKAVYRQNLSAAGHGIVVDPNQTFRSVSCTAVLTGAVYDTFDSYIHSASPPEYDNIVAVGGGVREDGAVETDQTAETNEATPDDMDLLMAGASVNDGFYFGLSRPFKHVLLDVSTVASSGVSHTITWEYSTGADAWSALSGVVDNTDNYKVLGTNTISWTVPIADWATDEVGAIPNLYWVRGRLSALAGGWVSLPKGQQAWLKGMGPYITLTDSAGTFVIPCAVTACKSAMLVGDRWAVSVTFTERSA